MIAENPELCHRSLDDIVGDLPSNYTYVLVYPFSREEAENNITPPVVLTFPKTKDLSVLDLKGRFVREAKSGADPEKVRFEMEEGTELDDAIKLSDICRRLRLGHLEKMPIFLKKAASFQDECCMATLIESERAFCDDGIEICFSLPNKQAIYLNVAPKSTFETLSKELATEIKRVFAYDLNPDRVTLKFGGKTNAGITYRQLAKGDAVTVELTAGLSLPEVKRENNSFMVIKGQGLKPARRLFDEIKMKKTKDLLNEIQEGADWSSFGLNVNGFILKPNEKIEKLANLFTNSTMVCRNIAATIVTESQMFELEQGKIKESGKLDYEKIIAPSPNNQILKT